MAERRMIQASGPDAKGKRRVLPAMTGQALAAPGTCPGCGLGSHPLRSCDGKTTEQAVRILRKLPGSVYVPLRDDAR